MPGRAEYRNRNEVQSDKKLPPDRFILAAITDEVRNYPHIFSGTHWLRFI